MQKICAHGVNLPFDGVARDSPPGPALGHHSSDPHGLDRKQTGDLGVLTCAFSRCRLWCLCMKPITVQCKVLGPGDNTTSKYGLKLWPGFKPLHTRPHVGWP